jgi:ribosomal protein S18 acetylase RimI-like enzyme
MQDPSSGTTIHHLEMCDPTAFRPKAGPPGFTVVVVTPPNPALNRRFYCSVGASWEWTDRLEWSERDWNRYVRRDALKTWVGRLQGQAVGYFELESQSDGDMEITAFGLLPEFIGQGLGGPLLSAAVRYAWAEPGTRRIWVHTCTRDHHHALGNYRKRGFRVFKTV